VEDWAKKINELIPKLVKEHKEIHEMALKNGDLYRDIRDSFNEFVEKLQDHMYSEETWIFPFMIENGFFDEKSEETASQHQEITSILVYLEKARKEDFSKKYSELIELLIDHHTSEEEYIFPRVLKFIEEEKG